MKILKEYPPNIVKIRKAFPINVNTVFTYGDTIYAPLIEFQIPTDLLVHEQTHAVQQGADPEGWWDRYISDVKFRFNQEMVAYKNQYQYYCSMVPDRNRRHKFAVTLAHDFASPLYGGIVDFFAAINLIKG